MGRMKASPPLHDRRARVRMYPMGRIPGTYQLVRTFFLALAVLLGTAQGLWAAGDGLFPNPQELQDHPTVDIQDVSLDLFGSGASEEKSKKVFLTPLSPRFSLSLPLRESIPSFDRDFVPPLFWGLKHHDLLKALNSL